MPGLAWDLFTRDVSASAGFNRLAAVADKAAAATDRSTTALADQSKVAQRAAVAQLDLAAAQERYDIAATSGTASSGKLAAAQASLMRAQMRSAASTKSTTEVMAASGKKLTKGLTVPILALAGVAIDQAAKFQKATNVYVTAAGESQRNLEVVRSGIKSVATETGTSIDQLTAGEYAIEKAGHRGAAGITLLRAAAQGASEENANLADVISGATSVMASYHIGTDKSVQVINALKTGAGEAKTTMEDYVRSLSTVIPVASAAGVSLAQVLGAESTLTQHGTSPAEATQELAFTIRNLQAPSNVAVAAMNQLGISSVNVSENLGKRGLTGTLAYIESKLPKSGLVYLSTMKQMEAGTKDLTAMQAKMPPALRAASKGFLDGTVTAKAYRAQFRDLGAEGYAQGSSFLTLAAKVLGYNDSIKAGTPAQKTLAAELKAVYGGANGLSTALQLGGHNLDGFRARTDAVNKSLHGGGKDVEGWASTLKLASTQTAIAKEKLHVLAIDAGANLLPLFIKLVSVGDDVVTWIGNLSHTDKQILGWSLAFVAALGPVLSIGTRLFLAGRMIGSFVGSVGTGLARLGVVSEVQGARISTAMRGVAAGLAGASIGLAIGQLTRNASAGKQALGVLASAAAGAAAGFAIGGGPGAVVGGLAGAVSSAATNWKSLGEAALGSNDTAVEATKRQIAIVEQLQGQLQGVYNLQDSRAKFAILGQLSATDGKGNNTGQSPLQIAQAAGISPKQVMAWANGGADPITQSTKISAAGFKVLYNAVADTQGAEISLATNTVLAAQAQGKQLLTAKQLGFSSKTLGTLITGLNHDTAFGVEVMKENFSAISKTTTAMAAHGKSVTAVNAYYNSNISTLRATLKQLGFMPDSIQQIISTYGRVPTSVTTALTKQGISPADIQAIITKYGDIPANVLTQLLASDHASTLVDGLLGRLNKVPTHKTVTLDFVQNIITNRKTTGSGKGDPQVPGQTSALIGSGSARGNLFTPYAFGGMENHVPQIARPQAHRVRVWAEPETQGEAYIPLANDGRRPRARAIALETVRRLGGIAAFAGGGIISPTQIYRVGAGWGFQGQYYGGKTGQKDAASARADYIHGQQAAALYHSPEQRQQAITDTTAWRTAIRSGDVQQTRAAYATLYADAKAAGASRAALERLSLSEKKVIADLTVRAAITKQVTAAQTYLAGLEQKAADMRSAVASAVTGSFDIATSGTLPQLFNDRPAAPAGAGTMLTQITAAASKAVGFGKLLGQLSREGLDPTLLGQLAQAGPAAYDQAKALTVATPKQIAAIDSQYRRINRAASATGAFVSTAVFGSQIDVAKALLHGYDPTKNPSMAKAVRTLGDRLYGVGKLSGHGLASGLLGQQKAAGDAAAKLGARVEASLRKQLGIHSPSRVTRELGKHTGIGFALGLQDSAAAVASASEAVGAAGVPVAPAGGYGGGNVTQHFHEWNITEADNGMETHHKVMRRLALAGP